MKDLIKKLKGPIAILGASGFVGRNMAAKIKVVRDDVIDCRNALHALKQKPKTIFNLIAYGSHNWQTDQDKIYHSNFEMTRKILEHPENLAFYVHAGTSAEYGDYPYAASEETVLRPNSHYAASKAACSGLIWHLGRQGFPVAHLRLYHVYGPNDHEKKLIPQVINNGLRGKWATFPNYNIVRDYIHVDDVIRAFIMTALNLDKKSYGHALNVGTSIGTSRDAIIRIAGQTFALPGNPDCTFKMREWDCREIMANNRMMEILTGFKSEIGFEDGFRRTVEAIVKVEKPCDSE